MISQITGTEIKALRTKLGLSQSKFAKQFRLSIRTLQKWEQGDTRPETSATLLLRLIELEPHTIKRLIGNLNENS